MEWLRKGSSQVHIACGTGVDVTLWWEMVSVQVTDGLLVISGDITRNERLSSNNRQDLEKFLEHAPDAERVQILESKVVSDLQKYVRKMKPNRAVLRLTSRKKFYDYGFSSVPESEFPQFDLVFMP